MKTFNMNFMKTPWMDQLVVKQLDDLKTIHAIVRLKAVEPCKTN